MFDRNTKRDVTLEASRENSKPRAILKPRKVPNYSLAQESRDSEPVRTEDDTMSSLSFIRYTFCNSVIEILYYMKSNFELFFRCV